jgi:hypothetical protein
MTQLPDAFVHLPDFHIPDEFWPAYEYQNDARFVALYWTPYGDEAMVNDGAFSGDANWRAYLLLTEHPPNLRAFCETAKMPTWVLGSSDEEATHWLIVDNHDNSVYLAPAADAARFLIEQWPPMPPIEYTDADLEAIRHAFEHAIATINTQAQPIDLQALLREDDQRLRALKIALENHAPSSVVHRPSSGPTTQLIPPASTLPQEQP